MFEIVYPTFSEMVTVIETLYHVELVHGQRKESYRWLTAKIPVREDEKFFHLAIHYLYHECLLVFLFGQTESDNCPSRKMIEDISRMMGMEFILFADCRDSTVEGVFPEKDFIETPGLKAFVWGNKLKDCQKRLEIELNKGMRSIYQI